MDKKSIVDAVAEASGLSKKASTDVVDLVFAQIAEGLAKGEEVKLHGFGSFVAEERGERTGRNPRTGEEIRIAASKAPKFKPAKQLRDTLNPA